MRNSPGTWWSRSCLSFWLPSGGRTYQARTSLHPAKISHYQKIVDTSLTISHAIRGPRGSLPRLLQGDPKNPSLVAELFELKVDPIHAHTLPIHPCIAGTCNALLGASIIIQSLTLGGCFTTLSHWPSNLLWTQGLGHWWTHQSMEEV